MQGIIEKVSIGEEFFHSKTTCVFDAILDGKDIPYCFKAKLSDGPAERCDNFYSLFNELLKGQCIAQDCADCYVMKSECIGMRLCTFKEKHKKGDEEIEVVYERRCPGILMRKGMYTAEELDFSVTKDEYICLFVSQLLQCLDFLRRKEFIHGDIKPSNVIFDYGNENEPFSIKLADFESLASVGDSLGKTTKEFSAPEVLLQNQDVDTKADIWSFGVTLYFCLLDDFPFPDIRKKEKCGESLNDYFEAAEYLENPKYQSLTEIYKSLIEQSLQYDADQRPLAHILLREITVYIREKYGEIKFISGEPIDIMKKKE